MAVSYVLHGTGKNVRVSADTASKIRRVAEELNYRPNMLARSLRNRQTNMVGVVFQHFGRLSEQNPYYPMLLNGIMNGLFAEGYTLALCPQLMQGGSDEAILDGRFDGILWARPDFNEASIERFKTAKIPLVLLHAPPGSIQGLPTFCADNEGALRLVVDHLRDLGHHKIVFAITEVDAQTAEGKDRTEAFHNAMRDSGLTGRVFVWNQQPQEFAMYWAANRNQVTAMACFSDTLAGNILAACRSLSIRVPEDLSVVGFDSSTFCDRTAPPLTSVSQPVEKIAYEAVMQLISLIRSSNDAAPAMPNLSVTYECGLDVRASTAPPRA